MLSQSKAILRYVGREFGFDGKTSLDAAYIDQAIDTAEDIWAPVNDIYVGTKEQQITIADLFFFTAVDFVNFVARGADSLDKFPKLATLKSRIGSEPKIAAWLAERPPEPPYDLE